MKEGKLKSRLLEAEESVLGRIEKKEIRSLGGY
jgi:hypothetical protein